MRLSIIPPDKKWKACFLGAILFGVCYLGAGFIGIVSAIPLAQLYPDRVVPFVGWTIWIYVSHYIFIPFAYVVVKKPEDYSAMLYSMLIACIAACVIFISYPTLMYRQPLSNSPADLARSMLYLIDLPTNCFPSLHVALAMLAAFFMYKQNKVWGVLAVFWASLIILSTMTIKQHYFADVIGGAILAVASSAMATRGLRESA